MQSPEISIFLITAASYLVGFLVFGGYLSAFTGSIGHVPIGLTDLTLVDLIAILPITTITLISKAFRAFPRFMLYFTVYGLLPVIVSVIVYLVFGLQHPTPWSDTIRLLAITLWSAILFWVAQKQIRYHSTQFGVVIVLICLAAALYGATTPINTATTVSVKFAFANVANLFLIGSSSVLFLLSAFAVGIITAESIVERQGLGRISRIILSEPVSTFGEAYSEPATTQPGRQNFGLLHSYKQQTAYAKKYEYTPKLPIYLVATFRNFTLFYLPKESSKNIDGKTVIVTNHQILAVELSVDRKSEAHQ